MKSVLFILTLSWSAIAVAQTGRVDFYSPTTGYGEIRPLGGGRAVSILKPDLLDSGLTFLSSGDCVRYSLAADRAHAIEIHVIDGPSCR